MICLSFSGLFFLLFLFCCVAYGPARSSFLRDFAIASFCGRGFRALLQGSRLLSQVAEVQHTAERQTGDVDVGLRGTVGDSRSGGYGRPCSGRCNGDEAQRATELAVGTGDGRDAGGGSGTDVAQVDRRLEGCRGRQSHGGRRAKRFHYSHVSRVVAKSCSPRNS